jgi:Putative transposase, YhgA-like
VDRQRLRRLVRHFPENGLKVLLENPGNVRDLLQLLEVQVVLRIDFTRMQVEAAQFVQRDYRHLESDVVLRAPLRVGRRGRPRWITIYILIEHQSEPDRFMVFRVLEYVLQIYKRQLRDWQQEHGSLDEFHFQPVLPVVLAGLMPEFLPLFLNVSRASAATLEARGGAFGLLLRLVQQRRVRRTVFEATLRQVVRALEAQLAEGDRARWLELLTYLSALIYHEREEPEQQPLWRLVEDAVQQDRHRREVFDMGKTMAESLMEEGAAREAVRSRQQTLLRQLRVRFRRVPEDMVKRVENTMDVAQLDAWLDAFAKARKLADVAIPPLSE